MKLFIAVRWGNAESPDGPDGEDTHFLIRAQDFSEGAKLADDVLRSLPTASTRSKRQVQPFCHSIIEIGSDASEKSVPQVLLGPWFAHGNVHHVYYATWTRGEEKDLWQEVRYDIQ
jgi:hypothetical protein